MKLNNILIKKVLLLLITIIFFMIFMELLFLFVIDKQDFFLVRINKEYTPYFSLKPFQTLEDFETPGTVNSIGLRSKEYSVNKSPDIYRIAMLGDSFTFGYGNYLNETIPYILEDILNSNSNKSFEVINFGIPGFNTGSEYYSYIENAVYFSPNLVILNYFSNDPTTCIINNTHLDFFRFLSYNFLELNLNYHNLNQFNKYWYRLQTFLNPCWGDVNKYISLLSKEIKSKNQSFMIVFMDWDDEHPLFMEKISDKIKYISKNNNVSFLSVSHVLESHPEKIMNMNIQKIHYTYFANQLIANETYSELVRKGVV